MHAEAMPNDNKSRVRLSGLNGLPAAQGTLAIAAWTGMFAVFQEYIPK